MEPADEAILRRWPSFMALPTDFYIIPPTLKLPQASSLPNFYSAPGNVVVDELKDAFSVPTSTMVMPYPATQFVDAPLERRAQKMVEYTCALRRKELVRRGALGALAREGKTPLDADAGERLAKLGAPLECVAANSAALTHRHAIRKGIVTTMADKELQSRATEVQLLKLMDLTLEVYMMRVHPSIARPIVPTQHLPSRRRYPLARPERPRPDLPRARR
jgi:hypothetical protein